MTDHTSKLLEWIEDNTGIIPDSQEAVDAIVMELQTWWNEARGKRKLLGHCGVDSGLMMLIDPCYIDYLPSYERICRIALDSENMGGQIMGGPGPRDPLIEVGVVGVTAMGDGLYPVHARYDADSRIIRLEIDFMV